MPCLAAILGLTIGILLFGRKTLKLIFQNPVDNEFSAWKGSFSAVIQCWHADFAIPFFILLFFC